MQTIIIAVLVAVAVAVPTSQVDTMSQKFEAWKALYNKVYSGVEHDHRFSIFSANLNMIDRHNAAGHSWTMAANQFADMTPKEFADMQTLLPSMLGTSESPATHRHQKSNLSLPTTVDWRSQGLVGDVKNQASCGSCWAFSTIVSLEGQVAKKTGTYTSFSEQDLVDCVKGESAGGEACCDGCQGGLMDAAFQYMIDHQGGMDDTESAYPYKGVDQTCGFSQAKTAGVPITGFTDIAVGDEDSLKDAVANVGPVSVAVDANMFWQFYSGGIFSPLFCNKSQLNHGVAAVGYGDGYWIIRNSWGAVWGEKGYMRMKMGSNECGVAQSASYPNV